MKPDVPMIHFQRLQDRIAAIEELLSRRISMVIFLVIRLIVISAMLMSFSWYSLQSRP
jgi:hypothetical protein